MDRRCAKILVEVDIRDGLYEEILMELHDSTWKQWLYYWKIPFQCFACGQVGHIIKDCPKNSESHVLA